MGSLSTKFKDGDTEREIFSKFHLRMEPVRRVGREISLLFGRTIIRVMVGVGRKNSGKGKCSPTNSCKDGPAFSHENRNAPLPKFSARFDMFLSVPGRAKSQLELEKEL